MSNGRQTLKPKRRRLRAVPAELIVPGDTLWSSATERPLFVIACAREMVDPEANLMHYERDLGDPAEDDEPRKPPATKVPAIIFSVRGPAGDIQRLGAFAPSTRVQVLR
jgi:hypothetical protein